MTTIATSAPNTRASRKLSRRQVMVGAAGLTFALALPGTAAHAAASASERAGKALNPWLSIAPDGTITIMSAGDRDGAGLDDLAAADPRRGARRRLVEGAHRAGAADRPALRQSRLRRHDLHRRQQCGAELFPAAAHLRRAGAPRAARQRREEARRAGRRADHRAERRRARQVGPAPELWRDRGVRGDSRQGAGDQAGATEAAERVPPDRQGRDARRAAGQGQRQRAICHRRAGAGHALRRGAARAGRGRRAGADRRRQGARRRRRGQDRPAALRRRRASPRRRGRRSRRSSALAAPSPGPRPARPGASTATRASSDFAAAARDLNAAGTDWFKAGDLRSGAAPRRRPPWRPSISATTPITRRWSR